MQHFSTENLDKLDAEHRLVSATITQLQTVSYGQYASRHGSDAVIAAISNLKIKKIELEGQIDVLNDYLHK